MAATKTRTRPIRSKEMTWGDVIAACKVHGKDQLLKVMQGEIDMLEGMQAHLWGGDYDEQHQASRMSAGILRRLETVIRLKAMDDAAMDRMWAKSTAEEQNALLAKWR